MKPAKPEKPNGVNWFELLAENMPVMVNAITRDARFVFWNRACETVTGYTRDEIIDNPGAFALLYPDPAYRQQLSEKWQANGFVVDNEEIDLRAKDGSCRTIRWTNLPFEISPVPDQTWAIGIDITARKKSEHELAGSEARYRELFNNINNGVAVYEVVDDGKDFIFRDYNKAAERLDAQRKKDLIGRSIFEVRPAVEKFGLIEVFRRVWKTGQPEHHPVTMYEDEELRGWYDNFVYKLSSGELVAVFDNVTKQKQDEEALRTNNEKLREVTESISDILWSYKVNVDGDLIEESITPQADTFLKLPSGTIRNSFEEYFSHVHPDDIDCVRQVFRNFLSSLGQTEEIDYRVVLPDGIIRWAQSRGTCSGLPGGGIKAFGITTDITERKNAETQIKAKEAFLNRIIDQSPIPTWISDEHGTLQRANSALKKTLNLTDEQLVGIYNVLEDPHIREQGLLPLVKSVFEDGKTIHFTAHWSGEGIPKWDLKGNRSVEIDATMFPIHNAEGRLTNVVLHWLDITEKKIMAERLHQMEKMDAIGQLAGGIAHDFNNQLAGIMGYGDMLAQRMDDPKLKKYAESIVVCARRAADLTAQLLAFSRKGQYQLIPVNLHKTIAEVVTILEHSIDKRIEIQQVLRANPAITDGDPSQLQSAILNLALNARDAMPDGGELIFATTTATLDQAYCDTVPYDIQPGTYVRVSVTDTGAGMDQKTRKHIFEPFFTTKEVGKGTGMGLAAVYGTVKHHGGAINVYSEPGKGSTFRLFLPVSMKSTVEIAADSTLVPANRTASILLVDDEALFRELATDILTEAGYSVHALANGKEAVDYYREHFREIDIVILDMIMPRMSGQDAFREMKEINPGVRVLLASGYSINGTAQALLDEGVTGFLQKPFTQAELTRKTADILA